MSSLYIIRGLPGSGKSTLAKKIAANLRAEHWEADQYFVDKDGNYNFRIKDIAAAHEYCTRGVIDAMYHNVNVIVSNTFTRFWEMEDYLSIAERLLIPVIMIECTNNYGSIHGVPDDIYNKMKQRWVSNAEIQEKFVSTFCNLSDEKIDITFQDASDYD